MRWGPQPYEALVSEVCSAFGCTPREAERQDIQMVRAVLDYRNAKAAVEMFNSQEGRKELAKHAALGDLLLEMHRAHGSAATRLTNLEATDGG